MFGTPNVTGDIVHMRPFASSSWYRYTFGHGGLYALTFFQREIQELKREKESLENDLRAKNNAASIQEDEVRAQLKYEQSNSAALKADVSRLRNELSKMK